MGAGMVSFDYNYTYEDEGESNMPIITLEVLSDSSNTDCMQKNYDYEPYPYPVHPVESASQDVSTGVHFLTETPSNDIQKVESDNKEPDSKDMPKARNDLLEYMTRSDGSVICKLCGEILQSRTHWYRHKYKLHVIQPLNPAPLFQCEQCLVYFKSRKGYIGHLASRHSEILADSSPVLTNTQAEALAKEKTSIHEVPPAQEVKEEPDPELSIPKTSVPNYQASNRQSAIKVLDTKKTYRGPRDPSNNKSEWEEKRSKEEKLVADIIDRVRRECEAQGSGSAARRGYTRRTTVMHTS